MRNPTHAGATVQQVEKEMMLWLRGSGDRERDDAVAKRVGPSRRRKEAEGGANRPYGS